MNIKIQVRKFKAITITALLLVFFLLSFSMPSILQLFGVSKSLSSFGSAAVIGIGYICARFWPYAIENSYPELVKNTLNALGIKVIYADD